MTQEACDGGKTKDSKLPRSVLRALSVLSFLLIASCTSVPFETPRAPSKAAPGDTTSAAQISRQVSGGGAADVALVPLPEGNEALGARLRLIDAAESSIDIKTFLVKPDASAATVWLALYDAAERGVRIRLLIDDVFTTAEDEQIAALDAHPNVQIRYFNPLSRNAPTALSFLLDFSRVNRRMHNKAMVVDGSLAIIGGRNYANEYYQIGVENEFADFDLFVAGAPVQQLSSAFDLYWNDPWSLPASTFSESDGSGLAAASTFFAHIAKSDSARRYRPADRSRFVTDLETGNRRVFRGTARVVVDDPAKLRVQPYAGPYNVANSLYQTMSEAERDILVLTPYFVPEDYGAAFFEQMVERGVRVRIVTNSLAATNHSYVHGAYARYRDRLLASGVEIIEVRSDAPTLVRGVESSLTMHTKLAVVDGETVFVGSTNIDPRSVRQNSEIGMIIESPGLAGSIVSRLDEAVNDYAFSVRAGEDGEPIWVYMSENLNEVYTSEPGAGLFRRIVATVAGWLPIESQL